MKSGALASRGANDKKGRENLADIAGETRRVLLSPMLILHWV
jgi:hypothetical protein